MSTVPGENVSDAVELCEVELWELHPGATEITVVVVAKIEHDGQDPIYTLGGAARTTLEDAEQIVQRAGEMTRRTALLRRLQRAGLANTQNTQEDR